MKYLQLSNNDKMPMLGLGTWKSAKGEIYQTVRKAIEIGYRHFDCAFIYGNENEIGQAISDAMGNKEVTRDELWITSKLWNNRHKKADIQSAIETTLASLKLEYVDLYLIHWPVAIKYEVHYPQHGSEMEDLKHIPLAETWEGMIALKDKQWAKHIGVSNFSIKKNQSTNCRYEHLPGGTSIRIASISSTEKCFRFCSCQRHSAYGVLPAWLCG